MPPFPTLEQLTGRQLRLLRQGRSWSQQDVAREMGAYGYSWTQSTIARIEAASRPLRLNELADLAALFGVSVTQLLGPEPGPVRGDDLGAIEEEIHTWIASQEAALARLRELESAAEASEIHLDSAMRNRDKIQIEAAEVRAELERINRRLEVLRLWHPQYEEIIRNAEQKTPESHVTGATDQN